ncbi:hypothetical protein AMS68_001572 [Peltaster fructicola]|uniref:NADH dehydrogenase [ubiquinone] iron-sulfur protein 5 n=1 Tax=Peltaster fructicola TaxID=286661 RepID=A0A6H0XN42_9PEZI|nr:hypothetical protein AMS68_001572 [Peltaster fructicola]
MASGYGLNGGAYDPVNPLVKLTFTGPSRCFPFWQEVLACYVVNTNADDDSGKKKCVPVLEDYYECLHHKKERARVSAIQAAYRRAEQQQSQDNVPTADEIKSLGLLKGTHEEKHIKHGNLLPTYSRN